MKLKRLDDLDFNKIVSSYVLPDIFDLIWILIHYGKEIIIQNIVLLLFLALERGSKNMSLNLEVEKGTFELKDDGEGLNLKELSNESILLKSKPILIMLYGFTFRS